MPTEYALKETKLSGTPSQSVQQGYSPQQLALRYAKSTPRMQSFSYRSIKRLLDLLLCIASLPVTGLLLLVLTIIVLVTSGLPFFYRQKRVGRNGKTFILYKFRTMRPDSAQLLSDWLADHPDALKEWLTTQKLRQDPRIIRGGRFLRETSLDELPQLLNVLRGEMSLVGPRPVVEAELERYGSKVGFYLAAVPGLTGLWQVSGRCSVSYEQRVRMDEDYVRSWSLWQDLLILLRTPLSVLRRDGAC